MTPTKIRYLIAIIEQGSLIRAAEFLSITQPPLSNLIKSLEEKYKTKLFTREKNKLIPTKSAFIIAEKGKEVLRLLEEIERDIENPEEQNKLLLRLGVNYSSSMFQIPEIIRKIKENVIDIAIDTQESNTTEALDQVLKNTIDIGLCRSKVHHKDIITTVIHEEDLLIAVSEDNPLSKKKSLDINDLVYEKIMLQKSVNMPGINSTLIDLFHKNEINPNIVFTGMSSLPMILMVAENMGICFAPSSFKNLNIKVKVKFIPLKNKNIKSHIYMIHKKQIDKKIVDSFLLLGEGIFNKIQ